MKWVVEEFHFQDKEGNHKVSYDVEPETHEGVYFSFTDKDLAERFCVIINEFQPKVSFL